MMKTTTRILGMVALVAWAACAHAIVVNKIATGRWHTCALTKTGGVVCWGYNGYGQVGDGSTTNRLSPVAVSGLGNGMDAIGTGGYHSCAVTDTGGVECWGYNGAGGLGNGNTTGSDSPVTVTGLSGTVSQITAGLGHTCALTTGGALQCWGYNDFGQVGDGSNVQRNVPVAVEGLGSGVSMVAAGVYHTCAVTTAGGVKCWGSNSHGQLGNNSTTDSPVPVDVNGLSSGVSQVAAGLYHSCALMTAGNIKCWGYNNNGQLGNNTGTQSLVPVDVSGIASGAASLSAGDYSNCVLMSGGGVKCWGYNSYGQLGDNTTQTRLVPVDVVGVAGATAMAAGAYHVCTLVAAGVVCWGNNSYGQLGTDTTAVSSGSPSMVNFGMVRNDFDKDGQSDMFLLDAATGSTQYWKAATIAQKVYPGKYNLNYRYAGSGDFDGDGKTDLLFTSIVNHQTMIWSGAAKSAASYPGSSANGFAVAAICDMDGDGKDDILWFNSATGATQVWPAATKAKMMAPGSQDTAYRVAACADVDVDKKADIFWRNAGTGDNIIWLAGNPAKTLAPGNSTDPAWSIFGAGDVDGDGKSDVIWYNASTGGIQIWHGGMGSAITYPGTSALNFTPKAIGDYDGDGKADLLWSNDSTRATRIWYGVSTSKVNYPGKYASGFEIQE